MKCVSTQISSDFNFTLYLCTSTSTFYYIAVIVIVIAIAIEIQFGRRFITDLIFDSLDLAWISIAIVINF